MTPTVDIVLRNTKIMTDDLRGHKVVYLFYNGEKVGRMEYRINKTPFQGDVTTLSGYNFTSEYMELFKGEENPLQTITRYFRTLIV